MMPIITTFKTIFKNKFDLILELLSTEEKVESSNNQKSNKRAW